MSYNVIATKAFERRVKKLAKKYPSIINDLIGIIEQLEENPKIGTPLGKDCFKIRVAIKSKNTGKSGGARLITLVRFENKNVFLLDIFDKSDQETITDKELELLIKLLDQDT